MAAPRMNRFHAPTQFIITEHEAGHAASTVFQVFSLPASVARGLSHEVTQPVGVEKSCLYCLMTFAEVGNFIVPFVIFKMSVVKPRLPLLEERRKPSESKDDLLA